jgi:hypothetical protein
MHQFVREVIFHAAKHMNLLSAVGHRYIRRIKNPNKYFETEKTISE